MNSVFETTETSSMGPKMKKCCEKFKLGLCTNEFCPFPHVIEAEKYQPLRTATKIQAIVQKGNDDLRILTNAAPPAPTVTVRQKKERKLEMLCSSLSVEAVACARPLDGTIRMCMRCRQPFGFENAEKEWYDNMKFHYPKTCKPCREARFLSVFSVVYS